MAVKNYENAKSDLLRALELNPGYLKSHYRLAQVYYAQQDYAAARDSYRKAAEIAEKEDK